MTHLRKRKKKETRSNFSEKKKANFGNESERKREYLWRSAERQKGKERILAQENL